VQTSAEAFVIDAALDVALLLGGDGTLVPRLGVSELTDA